MVVMMARRLAIDVCIDSIATMTIHNAPEDGKGLGGDLQMAQS